MTRLRSLRRDRRGVTVVEFAIILPAMLTLICGAVELGHLILARVVLDSAVVEAARLATASLETNEATRTQTMRTSITRAMAQFPLATGRTITIETKVYRTFSTAYPETFTDKNKNGTWDTGEDYVDRNKNGVWDPAIQIAGTLGGPGDIVAYTAVFPKRVLFQFAKNWFGGATLFDISATTIVRNESFVQKSPT